MPEAETINYRTKLLQSLSSYICFHRWHEHTPGGWQGALDNFHLCSLAWGQLLLKARPNSAATQAGIELLSDLETKAGSGRGNPPGNTQSSDRDFRHQACIEVAKVSSVEV